ncbi:MAG: ComEC/Rec2 family competence protein [Cellulosilyticaceae bacterium]
MGRKFTDLHKRIIQWSIGVVLVLCLVGIWGEIPEGMLTELTEGRLEYSQSEVHFIDTGNSDAILIVNDGKTLLVDGGDNDDEARVVNYLRKQGVRKLDYVVATHPHADHIGGLDAVLDHYEVGQLLVANGSADTKTYRDFIEAAMNRGVTPSVPLEGSHFELGEGSFTVLNTQGAKETNNQSLVITYVNGKDKVLLMGDAEAEVERRILKKVGPVDVLKLGHHGSRSSTTQDFLDRVKPKYAVITCGVNNKYGHPHKETLDKLKHMEVHRSDKCGDIVFISTGEGMLTDCQE